MSNLTEVLHLRIEPELKQAIEDLAQKTDRKPAAWARHMLRKIALPDRSTLELPENLALMTDAREKYVVEGE